MMCLVKTEVNMYWCPIEKSYIGYGYKIVDGDEDGIITLRRYKFNQWMTAKGNSVALLKDRIEANDGTVYHPGFHIFLSPRDAYNYDGHYLIKVKFKNLLSYGYNWAGSRNGKCIIAEKMKVIDIVARTLGRNLIVKNRKLTKTEFYITKYKG